MNQKIRKKIRYPIGTKELLKGTKIRLYEKKGVSQEAINQLKEKGEDFFPTLENGKWVIKQRPPTQKQMPVYESQEKEAKKLLGAINKYEKEGIPLSPYQIITFAQNHRINLKANPREADAGELKKALEQMAEPKTKKKKKKR